MWNCELFITLSDSIPYQGELSSQEVIYCCSDPFKAVKKGYFPAMQNGNKSLVTRLLLRDLPLSTKYWSDGKFLWGEKSEKVKGVWYFWLNGKIRIGISTERPFSVFFNWVYFYFVNISLSLTNSLFRGYRFFIHEQILLWYQLIISFNEFHVLKNKMCVGNIYQWIQSDLLLVIIVLDLLCVTCLGLLSFPSFSCARHQPPTKKSTDHF